MRFTICKRDPLMPVWIYCLIAAVLIGGIGLVLYWQLVIAEGAYLGPRVVALLYDWFAPHYDRVKQFDKAGDALMLAAPILRHLSASAVAAPHVLDVATGTGRLPEALLVQRRFRGHIVALDLSARMLEMARAKLAAYAERVTFIQLDAQRLPFEANMFDVVTCLEALEFMRDPRDAVREMVRVLKPGGMLMISNRIGPDAWKLPGRTLPTQALAAWLSGVGLWDVRYCPWLVDYDLVTGVKS